MNTSKIDYLGGLRTNVTHIRSGQTFITDAPIDNQGRGEAISPTDLTATSLAACAVTTMAIAAAGREILIEKMDAEVLKIMKALPRRIGGIDIAIKMKISPDTPENREILEKIGLSCPVALSLHPDLIQNINFVYA